MPSASQLVIQNAEEQTESKTSVRQKSCAVCLFILQTEKQRLLVCSKKYGFRDI